MSTNIRFNLSVSFSLITSLIRIHLSIATIPRGSSSLLTQTLQGGEDSTEVCRKWWQDMDVHVPLLCSDLKTEESDDCDLGDCAKPKGLWLSSHQGLITANCRGLIGPGTGMPSEPKTVTSLWITIKSAVTIHMTHTKALAGGQINYRFICLSAFTNAHSATSELKYYNKAFWRWNNVSGPFLSNYRGAVGDRCIHADLSKKHRWPRICFLPLWEW